MVIPHVSVIMDALIAIRTVRHQLEREPLIDIMDESGLALQESDHWKPSFSLDHVTFAYPSRPDHKALDDISIDFPPGKFTAVVGPSGSGKSTVASLLLREYDPETANLPRASDMAIQRDHEEEAEEEYKASHEKAEDVEDKKEKEHREPIQGGGVVSFAGHDVRNLNLHWLRRQVAVVSQNPQLFSGSILDNVAAGLTDVSLRYQPDIDNLHLSDPATVKRVGLIRDRCEEALRKAQAWEFVDRLPDGMDTLIIGGRTGVLSGGQLQRVALARALVGRPECLLLDEATSAVAADAELHIKDMLDEEQQERGMTLVVIAHRLSSVISADNIVVMRDGRVVTQGVYEDLMDETKTPDDTFRNMVNARQKVADAKTKDIMGFSGPPVTKIKTGSMSRRRPSIPFSSTRSLPRITTEPARPSSPTDHPMSTNADEVLGERLTKATSIFRLQRWALIAGTLFSVLGGVSFVFGGLLTGGAVNSLSIKDDNTRMRREMDRWALWFFVIALADIAIFIVAGFSLESAGTEIKAKLTMESLRAIIKQDTSFFESREGGSGQLTSGVTEYPDAVSRSFGIVWLQLAVAVANLLGSVIASFAIAWRIAVVAVPTLALCCFAGWLNFSSIERFEELVNREGEQRADFINEAVNSIRTISALTREQETLRRFQAAAQDPKQQRQALTLGSFGFGLAQGTIFLYGAFIFWWGAKLVVQDKIVS